MNNSSLSYIKWKCQYHIVFIPKYRKKVLYGQVKVDVWEIIKKLCEYRGIEGAVCPEQTTKWSNILGTWLLCNNGRKYHRGCYKEIYTRTARRGSKRRNQKIDSYRG